MLLKIEKSQADWEFCPLPARIFHTIKVNISQSENPQEDLLKAISKTEIENAVIRLIYQLRSEQLDLIENQQLHHALSGAHSYTIQPELVSQLARPRLPELDSHNSIDPLDALKTYLGSREDLQEIVDEMMEAAQKLMIGEDESWFETGDKDVTLSAIALQEN